MAFDPDFLSMMEQTATYYPATSLDKYGKVVVGAGTTIPCHTTYKTVVNYGNEEENQTSNAQVQMPPPGYVVRVSGVETAMPTVTNQDQILLADGTLRHVLWVSVYFDGGSAAGAHHQSLFLD